MMIWQKNVQRIVELDNIEKQLKKFVKSECEESHSNDLTESFGASFFQENQVLKNVSKTFKSIWRPNAWMDSLEKRILLYQFLFYCLQVKLFSPWIAFFSLKISMNQTFLQKANHNLSRLWTIEAIHGGKDLSCKK